MTTLRDLYIEELQDLWSANDQMQEVVGKMALKASDTGLSDRLSKARDGIGQHTKTLKSLLEDAGGEAKKDHCQGMEGLVKEAHKRALDSDLCGAALDVAIIAQYQRMCHYGVAGFGSATALADALGEDAAADKLESALTVIYRSDEFMTDLAAQARNLGATG